MTTTGVSVILTTYKGATRGYLKESIKSVLNQTHPNIELIIVDDGSADGTRQICDQFLPDPRVKYIYQNNKGLSSARNTGIRHATTDYICFLDDDDLYEKQMIEKLLYYWENLNDPSCGLVYCAVTEINEAGVPIKKRFIKKTGNIYQDLLWGNFISAPSALMIKKSVFEQLGCFNIELTCCEDYEMWLKIAKVYQIQTVDEPLVRYRIHQNQMSNKFKKMQETHKSILDKHLKVAPQQIQNQKHLIYRHYHQCCAAQYLGHNKFSEFRTQYRHAISCGKIDFIWTMKYYLSYMPPLFKLLQGLKRS
jgi:glycosyltransferase involved in cell wall biosynthesis